MSPHAISPKNFEHFQADVVLGAPQIMIRLYLGRIGDDNAAYPHHGLILWFPEQLNFDHSELQFHLKWPLIDILCISVMLPWKSVLN